MRRITKTLLVLVLAALLPLRAVAGVVIGYCAGGHQAPPAAEHSVHGAQAPHGAHAADDHATEAAAHAATAADEPAKPVSPTCSICAEHCSSAGFAPGASVQSVTAFEAAETSAREYAHAASPFFPDQIDRPPLA